ncbi:MAG: hypothetical protein KJ000_34600 [Pirellulaceae bacterium]|nr:hypothetical protein [Pirellulaceae bacterium]
MRSTLRKSGTRSEHQQGSLFRDPVKDVAASESRPHVAAFEAIAIDDRCMAVRFDCPVVVPNIAHMVMLGIFQLPTGNQFRSFRGIGFDHRFTENRIDVGHNEFGHDKKGERK